MFRFRIKPYFSNESVSSNSSKFRIDIDSGLTVSDLKSKIVEVLQIDNSDVASEEIGISLNKREEISLDSSVVIRETQLCNGDIIYAKLPDCLSGLFQTPDITKDVVQSDSSTQVPTSPGVSTNIKSLMTDDKIQDEAEAEDIKKEIVLCSGVLLKDCLYPPKALCGTFKEIQIKNEYECLNAILKSAAIEFGFVDCNKSQDKKNIDAIASRASHLKFEIPETSFFYTSSRSVQRINPRIMLVCTRISEFFSIHAFSNIQATDNREELCLDPIGLLTLHLKMNKYIMREDGKYVIQEFNRLSRILKDDLFNKVLYATATALNNSVRVSFLSLPEEIKTMVITRLEFTDLCALACTCREVCRLTGGNEIWKPLFLRQFGRMPRECRTSVKELFRREFIEQKRMKQEYEKMRNRTMAKIPLHHMPLMRGRQREIFPNVFAGSIGGDYDRLPLLPHQMNRQSYRSRGCNDLWRLDRHF